jgi:hypothetical protein
MLISSIRRAYAPPRSLRLSRTLSTSLRLSKPNPTVTRSAPAEALQSNQNDSTGFVDLENAIDLQAKDFRKGSSEYRSHIKVSSFPALSR